MSSSSSLMATALPSHSLSAAYCAAVVTTVGASLGLLCALLWRDLIFGVLKRHGVWDCDTGLTTLWDAAVLGAIALSATLITATVVVAGNRLCASKAAAAAAIAANQR
jgi:hypothetical protein